MSTERPHVICHMASSVDGKIDGSALLDIMRAGEYEALHAKLGGNAWVCGRTTMQQHFAEDEPFVSATNRPAGPQPVHVARRADSYAISVDTVGKLRWSSNYIDGDHLICIVSEQVPADYLVMLRDKKISYIVAGASSVDLVQAVDALGKYFGIRTLLLEGGGHINGGFLQAGLVDEVSLLLLPGIDGRHEIASVFDGVALSHQTAVALKLKSVEQREDDALWIRTKSPEAELPCAICLADSVCNSAQPAYECGVTREYSEPFPFRTSVEARIPTRGTENGQRETFDSLWIKGEG